MYTPDAFREDRPAVLHAAMANIQLAALVTTTPAGFQVTHVPMLLTQADGVVTLDCHVARGNPHWRNPGASVAIFQGPHAYISPAFYPSKAEHGKVVPTWTYIAIHAHGTLTTMDDPDWLHQHITALTDRNEQDRPAPWAVTDAPETYISALSRGIVGLRLTVDRIAGSWKVNQHKSDADRAGTAAGLSNSGEMGQELAQVLRPTD